MRISQLQCQLNRVCERGWIWSRRRQNKASHAGFLHLLLFFLLFTYEYSCILCKIFKGMHIMFLIRACAYLSLLGNWRQYCKKDTFEQGKGKVEEAESRETKPGRSPSFRLFNSLCTQLKSNDIYVFSHSYGLGFFFPWAGGTSQVFINREYTHRFW